MIRDGLYHSTIYFPKDLTENLPKKIDKIVYCNHAKEKAKERKIYHLPHSIDNCEISEVEVKNGEIVKALYKTRYSRHMDICLVFHMKKDTNGKYFPFMVRTLWVNNVVEKLCINSSRYNHE